MTEVGTVSPTDSTVLICGANGAGKGALYEAVIAFSLSIAGRTDRSMQVPSNGYVARSSSASDLSKRSAAVRVAADKLPTIPVMSRFSTGTVSDSV